MPKPSRWTPEKRYEIIREVLRHEESIAQIARKYQVSDAVIHRWRERFYEGGKAALSFDGVGTPKTERLALERQIEELQKVIGEQAVEIRFLKNCPGTEALLGRFGVGTASGKFHSAWAEDRAMLGSNPNADSGSRTEGSVFMSLRFKFYLSVLRLPPNLQTSRLESKR